MCVQSSLGTCLSLVCPCYHSKLWEFEQLANQQIQPGYETRLTGLTRVTESLSPNHLSDLTELFKLKPSKSSNIYNLFYN